MGAPLFVPKDTVEAELRDTRGRVRSVSLFLAPPDPDGPHERLRDVLQQRRFIPIRVLVEDGAPAFELMSRDHVVWLRLELMLAIDELDLEAEGAEESVAAGVRIDLDDGSSLEGGIRYLLPSDTRRVGDYLETLPEFFPVRTPDHLYLVHRERVVSVVPVDEVRR